MRDPTAFWAEEIRAYLLGRIPKNLQTGPVPQPKTTSLHPPALRWWIFEGKRYQTVTGPLAGAWGLLAQRAAALLATFNARLRVTDHPDSEIDWPRTLARGSTFPREYVATSSSVGLSEDERAALAGWIAWLADQWTTYSQRVDVTGAPAFESFEALGSHLGSPGPQSDERLRRWAHTARRSRWPLLRHVVAETLRCAIDTDEVDQLPVPVDRWMLFELLCLVRVARAIAPNPGDIRWLDREVQENSIRIPGARCRYQVGLRRADVLSSSEYTKRLAEALDIFVVGVPERIDALWRFDPPRSGFSGIVLEAKSGGQQVEDALLQLRTYRAALPRGAGQRFVVWGVAERSGPLGAHQLAWLHDAAQRDDEDVWVFSGPDDIAPALRALGIVPLDGSIDTAGAGPRVAAHQEAAVGCCMRTQPPPVPV